MQESIDARNRTERKKEDIEKERDSLLADKKNLNENLTATDAERKKFKEQSETLKRQRDELEQNLQESAKTIKDKDTEMIKLHKFIDKGEEHLLKEKESKEELDTQLNLEKSKNRQLEKEYHLLERTKNQLDQKNANLEQVAFEAEQEKDAAKSAVVALTREVEWLRKQTDVEKSDIMKLVRDRDIIKRTLHSVTETNLKNRNEIIQKEQTIQTTLEQNNKYKENI